MISSVLGRLESSRIGLASHKSARLCSESATASISSKFALGQPNLVSEHLAAVLFIETQFAKRFQQVYSWMGLGSSTLCFAVSAMPTSLAARLP